MRSCGGKGLVWLVCVAACGAERAPEPPIEHPATDVLADVPLFPRASGGDVAGTVESEQRSYWSAFPADTVAAWYRRTLLREGWELVSDHRAADGTVTVLALRDGAPLWVIIGAHADSGSVFELVGAAADSGAGAR